MYEELIQRLREESEIERWLQPHSANETPKLLDDAADAIKMLDMITDNLNYLYESEVPRWIPVTEKLPENQRPVLVCVPPYTDGEEDSVGYVGMAYFTDSANGGFWCGTDGNVYGAIGIIHEPSYWMPLPERTKEE